MLALVASGVVLWRTRWARAGHWLAVVGTVSMSAVALLPIAQWSLAPLENRFPLPQRLPSKVDGIIVLGGAVDPIETATRNIPSLNEAAERMTTFVELARLYPSAKKVFTGGNGSLHASRLTEADTAKRLFSALGVDTDHMIFEDRSRNTYENALYSLQLAKPEPAEAWILVTSAEHMPRVVGIFRRLGWTVIPHPVAYKSDSIYVADFAGRLKAFDGAVREWVGLVAYRLLDRTDALFPGPMQ